MKVEITRVFDNANTPHETLDNFTVLGYVDGEGWMVSTNEVASIWGMDLGVDVELSDNLEDYEHYGNEIKEEDLPEELLKLIKGYFKS